MEKLDPKGIENILALTPLQEGMLFHYLQDPHSQLYFEQLSLEISGTVDIQFFEKAWNVVVETNDMLRTVFRWEKLEKPSQIILKEHKCKVIFHDLADKDGDQKKTALELIKTKDRDEGFDLTQVPFRVTLCKLDETQYEMVISNYHILYDGWSNGIILKEFFKAYHALRLDGQSLKPPAKPPFQKFLKWIQSQDKNRQEQFWREHLAGVETATELPIKRRIEKTPKVEDYSFILEVDIRSKLDAFVRNNRITLAPVFYAVWGILLQKYGDSEDVIFGTTVSGRSGELKGIEDMVGLFINTIPLRIDTHPGEKIIDVVYRTDQVLREREEFENTPLPDIGSGCSCSVGVEGSLFDTIVVIENYPLDNRLVPEGDGCLLSIHSYSIAEMTHYDLSVGIMLFDEIEIKFSGKSGLFEKETIENLADHFKGIIQTIIENPETTLSQLEIISNEEKSRILYEFNNTTKEYPTDKTIHQLFAEQVEKAPDNIALIGADLRVCPSRNARNARPAQNARNVNLTYRQLNDQSDRLAGLLIEKGVQPDTSVGIMVERSIEMVIGIFGILKSGGAYLPIDPEYPQERIAYMLKDSGAKLLVTNNDKESEKVRSWEGEKVFLEFTNHHSNHLSFHHSSFIVHHSSHLAYLIYTSGSTGKPKGVMIEHHSLVNRLNWMQRTYPLDKRDTILQKTTFTFDVSAWEIFWWSIVGARLFLLAPGGEKDPELITQTIERNNITTMHFVPSMLSVFLDYLKGSGQQVKKLAGLKQVIASGEALLPVYVEGFNELLNKSNGTVLANLYGPTEATIDVSYFDCLPGREMEIIPIGKPIDNIWLYILDRSFHHQPVGVVGELHIGGAGLARGYLNRTELTAERFIDFHHPSLIIHHSNFYRTGDLARWLSDGNIEFLGRIDHQVKIRGFRIELGEIESRLLKHGKIKEAVVLAKEDSGGDKYLVAYFISDIELSDVELRGHLLKDLPDYMIPLHFVRLEKVPLTPGGKVDRRALPEPKVKQIATYVVPRNEIEKKLIEIWAEILGRNISLNRIGIDDNFFRLGGHSLKATSLASRIYKEFNVKIPLGEIFKRPTIRGLFDYINEAVGEKYLSIEPVEVKEYYILSSAQKRLYFLQQMDNAGTTYNISAAWVLEGIIDKPRLEQSIVKIILRHESLRTSFVIIGDESVQRIHDHVEFKIENYDLAAKDAKGREGVHHSSFIAHHFIRAFDLSKAPLLQVGLVKIEEDKHVLLVDIHHIISDGISTEILIHEFTAIYPGEELPAISLRYKDYAEWQGRSKKEENLLKQSAYWEKEFEGEIPVLELPIDYARPAVQSFEGNRITFTIGRETIESLNSFALETGMTLYMVLLALYSIFLARLSGQEDIITGTPVGGRRYADLEKIIGVFVNTLTLRNYPAGEKNFMDFLGEVKKKTLEAFENQEYQYEDLVEQVAVNRDTGRNPLFDVMFVLQNMGVGEIEIPGLKLTPYDLENKTSKFDLTLTGMEIEGKLEFAFEYCTKLFKQGTIERFITYFKNIVSGVRQDKCKRLADLEMLPVEEKNRILYEFNDTAAEYPAEKTIHQLFEEQALKTPDRIALHGCMIAWIDGEVGADLRVCPARNARNVSLTYHQLNEQSHRMAGFLIEKGVLADNIVGIMVELSVEMIIGLIGILKSGGAYLPIDPDYPQERIDYMLKDSGAKIMLGRAEERKSGKAEKKKNFDIIFIDMLEASNFLASSLPRFLASDSSNLAYIIYTSGTTGQPKGSLIEHRNVVRLLFNDKFQFDFTDRDIWTLFHSFCFDFSVWEMYGALLYGGKLLIVPKMVARDTAEFLELLNREAVTVLNQTPSAFYNLINEALSPHWQGKKLYIKYVIFGGEALNPLKLKDWLTHSPQTRLINMFGITETTVHATYKEITEKDMELSVSNIGKPIPTLRVYILDNYLKPVPMGVTGEIYVGGDGVARGYLNRPELTAEKFIYHSPLTTHHSPIYRSGDLARFLVNGDIEYLGRIDHQVKIRGFRIELGEIENRLLKYDGIKDAVVLVGETAAEKYLCAYIVSHRGFAIKELRTHLAGKLPGYMIPSYFVRLKQIPLTPNGKIDRKALPGIHGNDDLLEEYASPTTETEEKLAELWANVSGIKPGINVDFFHSGGDSIKAVRLVNSINTALSTHLKIADIYINGTIKQLASIIERDKSVYEYTKEELKGAETEIAGLKNKVMSDPRLPEGIEDIYPMSDIQKGMVFHSLKDREAALYHDQMVYQPVINDFNPGIFEKAFVLLVEKHPILRTVFIYDRYEEPVQAVYRKVPHNIEHDDISHMEKGEQENYLLRFLAEDRGQPFQFDIPPLWRLKTFDLGNENICVVLAAHHAILDGWSVASLDTELLNTYWQLKSNPAFTPGVLKNSYKAFIIEQAVEKKRGDAANFWRNELDGYLRLELSEINGNIGNTVGKYRFNLGKNLLSKVQETAKTHHTTLKGLCFSAYMYMLFMHSYENEMVVGLVTNNRPVCEDGDKILGCFLNTIPIRIIIPGSISWLDYMKLVDRKLLELKKYERMPLFEIVGIIGEDTQHRNPLFDVIFNFIDFHVLDQIKQDYGKNNTGKLHVEENVTTNTAFDFSVSTTLGDFELLISYSDSFFDEKTVKNLCCYFEGILNKFIAEPGSLANKVELIPLEERHRLLYEFNDTAVDYPKDKTIHELFAEQVEKAPNRIALVGATAVETLRATSLQVTYRQLNEQSDRLAGLLIEKGVLADNIVGIMMERSVEMIVGIMGILKSGGAYLPIDPEYPEERKQFMLKDSAAKILLTSADCVFNFHHSSFIVHHSNHLAYIIFTSGSSGRSKGVMVEHRNVVRLVKNTDYIKFDPGDRILQTGALAFDASTFEIWGTLLNGLTLYLVSNETILTAERLKKTTREYQITIMWMTSPLLNRTLEVDIEVFAGLRKLLVGGDKLSPTHINRLRNRYPHMDIINGYGPTENTTFSTTFLIDGEYMENIPIGNPIANSTAYIIDVYNHFQPLGVGGELCVGGDGLGRGYLNNMELTWEKFIQNPFKPGDRLYKTGDIARWLEEGNIEFLGRRDFQVKVRGYRVELGEIETQLLKHKDIKESVVIAKYNDIVAYIVPGKEVQVSEIREYLSGKLPGYMIPSYFVQLEKIPLTANGKVDRKVLPEPGLRAGESYTAPGNEIEKKLVGLWAEVLGRDALHAVQLQKTIGINDNFFQLGGHSLKATILVSKIHKAFHVNVSLAEIFKTPTVRGLSNCIKTAIKDRYVSIEPIEKKEYYALSSAQKRLYVLHRMDEQGMVYNLPAFSILEGKIDKDKLEHTFRLLIDRHESLRTSFHMINDKPVQRIHDEVEFGIEYKNSSTDYTDYTDEKDNTLHHSSFMNTPNHFIRAFDLSNAPLLRVGLVKEKEGRHILMVDMHHIISDGISMNIVVKDFMALYQGEDLPGLRVQYKDFSEWQNSEKQKESIKRQENFWLKEFEGEIPVLELLNDYSRPLVQSFEGNSVGFEITPEITEALKALTLETGITLYMALLAIYTIFLSKVITQEDIVVGSPSAGRVHVDLEQIIGMFVNTLALRNYPAGEKTFIGFLQEVKENTLKAFENQDYQYEDLVERVVMNMDAGRNPLFDVMFALQNTAEVEINIPGLKLYPYPYENRTAKFDLKLLGVESQDKLLFTFEYCIKLFKQETIERFIAYFKNIVNSVIEYKDRKISDFEIIPEWEKKRILFDFNDTEAEYSKDKTIHELFEEQVERTPDRIAVVGAAPRDCPDCLTYRQLNEVSNRLAYGLRKMGVGVGDFVGVIMDRCMEMTPTVMGILKAGGAYAPLEPYLPDLRIEKILASLKTKCVVTDNPSPSRVEAMGVSLECLNRIVCLDSLGFREFKDNPLENPAPASGPGDIGYVIYTSGSTGTPKGVVETHRPVVNVIQWVNKTFNVDGNDKLLFVASLGFDLSVYDIFGILASGGAIRTAGSEDMKEPTRLLEIMVKEGITFWDSAPATLQQLVPFFSDVREAGKITALRLVFLSGDWIPVSMPDALRDTFKGVRVISLGGATEATIWSNYFPIGEVDPSWPSIPYGKPIQNAKYYILYKSLQPCPIKTAGDLYIGGECLATEYKNDPVLTAGKFIANPFCPGERLYKTGDIARWLEDGNMQFLGRTDHQVKIRGFRIELGEIENRLLNVGEVKDAVVLVREEERGDKYLCAYVVSNKELSLSALRETLAKELPDYMIPSYFVQVAKIPLTANGKIDRKALPKPELKGGASYTAPRDEIERKLVGLWSEILGQDALHSSQLQTSIGIDDNFFELGGHSLNATILISKIHNKFDVKVPLAEIFKTPRIRELAEYIKNKNKDLYISIEPSEEKEYYELSPAQKRLYILQQLVTDNTSYNMPYVILLGENVEKKKLELVFKKLIERHDSFRTSFITVNEAPAQRIHREVDFSIGYYEIKEEAESVPLISGFTKPFNLGAAPLLRVNLIGVGSSRQVLYIDMHHIISDGTSQDILEKEFTTLCSGEELSMLRFQYKDYSEWFNRALQQEALKQQESYWLKEFSGELPVLDLPTDYPRPVDQGIEGNTVLFSLNTQETSIMKAVAQQNDVTLYMALLAVFSILFAKLSGQEDIIIGTPIAARRHAELQDVIGMLVSTLAMRNYPSGEKFFKTFLCEVKQRTLEAYENQEYPFEDLVEKILVNRDTGRNPVFDVMLNLLNQGTPKSTGEISTRDNREFKDQPPYPHQKATSRFDMAFSAMEQGERLVFGLEYSTRLFTPATIDRFIGYLKTIVLSLNKDQKLSEVGFIPAEEKQAILKMCNGVEEPCAAGETVHRLFEEQAARTPDRIALVGAVCPDVGQVSLTYRQLNEQANRLAHLLREKGIGPDKVVGLMVERSVEMIIALLAVIKAGGAYLPMDTEYPAERVLLMLADATIPVLLTQEKILQRFDITSLKGMKTGLKEEGLVVTPPRGQIKDLDKLPKPDRTLVDYKKYHQSIGIAMAKHTVSIQATRGCPFNCAFCHKIWPKTHVTRSAQGILEEIRWCYDAGVKRFVFIDDIFNLDKRASGKVFESIIKQNLDTQLFFPNGLRGDILDKDFIDLMVEAGTVNIDLALESASQRIQKLIHKNLNLEKFGENIRYIIEKYPRVLLEMELMIGFPTETEKEALLTFEFLKNLKWVHFPNLNILKIYPNTDMYRLARENGIEENMIQRSVNLAYHELPDTLPFSKAFVTEYQSRFMNEYLLSKERLLHVLPYQMKTLTGDELVQKYNSYLPVDIESFSDIIDCAGITREELGNVTLLPADHMAAPDFGEKVGWHFPAKETSDNPFKVLLLDLSLFFSEQAQSTHMLYDMIEEPLGLMYLLTYLNEQFNGRVWGKIAKSRIDFDSFDELKSLLREFKPHLIGIRTLSYYKEFFHRTVLMIRHWGIDAPIVAGGPYATSDYRSILQDNNVDLVVLGEGELTLAQLVGKMIEKNYRLPGQDVLKEIPGMAFSTGSYAGREIVLLDDIMGRLNRYPAANPPYMNRPDDLLYLIYTSGSTGTPKGVMLEHRNLLNLFMFQFKYTDIDCSRILQFSTISFDASFHEIFSVFLSGGQLFLVNKETRADVPELFRLIERNGIKTVFLPISFLKVIFNDDDYLNTFPRSVEHIQTAGEQVVVSDKFKNYLKENNVYLHNHYGPSETHVITTFTMNPREDIPEFPSIGKPIMNTGIYILDKAKHLLPIGVAGELYAGGLQVGRGYLNNPELTDDKFKIKNGSGALRAESQENLHHSSFIIHHSNLYRTGDLCKWLPGGNIEFLGRIDHQVKIRGIRVEPGEIESRLAKYPGIKEALVTDETGESGIKYLSAYIVSSREFQVSELRAYLLDHLPDYMIPASFSLLEKIPLTANGKIDKKMLKSIKVGMKTGIEYAAPKNEIEKKIADTWKEALRLDDVGIFDNFFEIGGNSLNIIIINNKIKTAFKRDIPIVKMFTYPTINSLANYINQDEIKDSISDTEIKKSVNMMEETMPMLIIDENEPDENIKKNIRAGLEVAVIGMAGRFPGSRNILEFWKNLKNGVESIMFFSDEEMEKAGISLEYIESPNYVKAAGVLEDAEYFDASFFGYTPKEAGIMNPEMRFFHECAWEALEDAGYNPDSYDGLIGVYAGASSNFYWQGIAFLSGKTKEIGNFAASNLTCTNFLPTLISYKLNLKGPSTFIQTACSTSLVAIHYACRSVLSGECHMALAGGVKLDPIKQGYMYEEGMILSPDGHCRAFDAEAKGTVGGNGIGIVVLKRLKNAIADRDNIYAVIKGSAINNDGNRKVGYTAPSALGQAEVIRTALAMSHVEPGSIGYIETHGTATPLGDPIEIEALTLAFNTEKRNYCPIGSVKSNIGHLDTAAGVTGFIKTVLALENKQIPPSLHFKKPNPKIDFKNSPFYVNIQLSEWKNNGHPRRAGVSSFGIGGTNAHVILEEAPGSANDSETRKEQLILLSGKTPSALERASLNLVEYLRINPRINLGNVAYTLMVGRKHFNYRKIAACSSIENAIEVLSTQKSRVSTNICELENRTVVYMFSGLGSQYINMGQELYQKEPVFRSEMDRCFEILKPLMNCNLKEILYPNDIDASSTVTPRANVPTDINQPEISQPIIFIFEYALAMLLMKWGIKPYAMIGYSLGEYAAACISGIFSLESALKLIVYRGKLIQKMPTGVMLSVPLPIEELLPSVTGELAIAIDNGPSCIIAGSEEAVISFEKQMNNRKVLCIRLPASHAIHSQMMEPILKEFEQFVAQFTLSKPKIPFISNLTGTWINDEEVLKPKYWVEHLRHMVRFADGMKELMTNTKSVFIEIGPGHDLSALAVRYIEKASGQVVINPVRHPNKNVSDVLFLLNKIGQMWLHGVKIDWNQFYPGEKRYRIPLPTYPFEGKPYLIEDNPFELGKELVNKTMFSSGKKSDIAGRFHIPSWKSSLLPVCQDESKELPTLLKKEGVAPTNEVERSVIEIWQNFFGFLDLGIADDFFELGGDSLKAIALTAQLKKEYPLTALDDVLTHSTIRELASIISMKAVPAKSVEDLYENSLLSKLECIEKLNKGRNEKNIFIVHPMHGMVNQYKELAVLLENKYNVYGIQARGLKPGTKMTEGPLKMVNDYLEQIQAVQKDGPYIIAGYCIGTNIAYEIVRQLGCMNHPVEKLILLDPHAFFTGRSVRIYRALEYLPGSIKKWIRFYYDKKFKKTIQLEKFGKVDGKDGEKIAGENNLIKENIEKYMRILGAHLLSLELIKAPILIAQAENGLFTHLTETYFNKMTIRKMTMIKIPGDHDSIWEKPYVEKLAEVIINNM